MTRIQRLLPALPLLIIGCDRLPTEPVDIRPQAGRYLVTGLDLASVSAGGNHTCGLASGGTHTCGLTKGGQAYCWGGNGAGQLGDGKLGTTSAVPSPVASTLSFVAISAGATSSCGLVRTGEAYCWGFNSSGQLGNGSVAQSDGPLAVAPPAGSATPLTFAMVSMGANHTCGVTKTGQAYCWGNGNLGQLGLGTGSATSSVPAPVAPVVGASSPLAFAAVSAGGFHSCGITKGGRAYCWGGSTIRLADSVTAQ